MRRRTLRSGALFALVPAIAWVALALLRPVPVEAQPTPELPAEQLTPALEVISPIVWPACGNALLVTVAPAALGLAIPPELAALFGPLYVVCGAVPAPDGHRVCALDKVAQDLLAQTTKALIGAPLPLIVNPVDSLAGQIVLIGDLVPALGLPLGATVDAVLSCVPPAEQPASPDAPAPEPPPVTSVPAGPIEPPPTFAELVAAEPLRPLPLPPLQRGPVVEVVEETPALVVTHPRFAYPVVMGIPLLLLVVGAYLGRALTRPLDPERP